MSNRARPDSDDYGYAPGRHEVLHDFYSDDDRPRPQPPAGSAPFNSRDRDARKAARTSMPIRSSYGGAGDERGYERAFQEVVTEEELRRARYDDRNPRASAQFDRPPPILRRRPSPAPPPPPPPPAIKRRPGDNPPYPTTPGAFPQDRPTRNDRARTYEDDEDELTDSESSSGESTPPPRRPFDGQRFEARAPAASGDSLGSSSTATRRTSTSYSSTSGRTKFSYSLLRPREIRLVRILPERMTTVKCQVVHASLDKPPRYTAISYAWGDPGDTEMIQVEGAMVPVTASLYGALKAVRRRNESILVWADALCIDQHNKTERTEQVQLMTGIYTAADSVAVWLGSDADDSNLAMVLLNAVAEKAGSPEAVREIIASRSRRRHFAALISLFERDYWRRLWVVQEVFNGRSIDVYCGASRQPYRDYLAARDAFRRHRSDIDHYFPGGLNDGERHTISQNQLPYSQVLGWEGPGSFPDLKAMVRLGDGSSLLEVLRACRRKLSADPRDKVFGVLGILPVEVRAQFPPDYTQSVTEVYTNVVDFVLTTTRRLDVMCEAIYFPLYTSTTGANLPTWVPDWSHVPQTAAMGLSFDFAADAGTKAEFSFRDKRRTRLQIAAIPLGKIRRRGIAVGTLCALDDFLMAFLHWRAVLLDGHDDGKERDYDQLVHEAFCRTLCLDQIAADATASPSTKLLARWKKPAEWMAACYHIFGSLIRDRLPHLPLDRELRKFADAANQTGVPPSARRRILQDQCGARMTGRCFGLTEEGLLCMGTGFMSPGDLIVVPLGCSTPIILRPEGSRGEYRFVGDIYVDGYMRGRAVDQYKNGRRELLKLVLH